MGSRDLFKIGYMNQLHLLRQPANVPACNRMGRDPVFKIGRLKVNTAGDQDRTTGYAPFAIPWLPTNAATEDPLCRDLKAVEAAIATGS
jgi:hypothetical protein